MKSILQDKKECFRCKTTYGLEEHHIFGGGLRQISENHGFKVYLCNLCHRGKPYGVHQNMENMNDLRKECQKKYEETHSHKEFMELIGRNYL